MNSPSCAPTHHQDYLMVEAAIEALRARQPEQPPFADIAVGLGVSEGHLRRLFRQWAGVTPKQFLQVLTVERAKVRLCDSATLLDTALDVGLSGASRLHDHFVTLEAMTPAQYRDGGASLHIRYGNIDTPFGQAFIAFTDRGVCQLCFTDGASGEDALGRLEKQFGQARLERDEGAASVLAARLWSVPQDEADHPRLSLLVKGTNFQVQVWRALLRVPDGGLVDYSTIAAHIGRPTATRAVASAIGANPVAVLIPCHRVIRRDGGLGGYRWGLARKQLMLVNELLAD